MYNISQLCLGPQDTVPTSGGFRKVCYCFNRPYHGKDTSLMPRISSGPSEGLPFPVLTLCKQFLKEELVDFCPQLCPVWDTRIKVSPGSPW